jgi:hypothetical protein
MANYIEIMVGTLWKEIKQAIEEAKLKKDRRTCLQCE